MRFAAAIIVIATVALGSTSVLAYPSGPYQLETREYAADIEAREYGANLDARDYYYDIDELEARELDNYNDLFARDFYEYDDISARELDKELSAREIEDLTERFLDEYELSGRSIEELDERGVASAVKGFVAKVKVAVQARKDKKYQQLGPGSPTLEELWQNRPTTPVKKSEKL